MMMMLFYPRNLPLKFGQIGSVIDEIFVVVVDVVIVVVDPTNLPLVKFRLGQEQLRYG